MEKEIVGYKMGICPHCGAELEDCYDETLFNDGDVGFGYTCHKCGAYGTEWYRLEPIESIAYINDESQM